MSGPRTGRPGAYQQPSQWGRNESGNYEVYSFEGTPQEIRREVNRLFAGFGNDGGYICSAADHFFEAPVANLQAFAAAAQECRY